MAQQLLDIGARYAIRRVLLRLHLAVNKGDGQHVRKAVISLLLCAHKTLVALLSTTDDLMGHRKGLEPHGPHRTGCKVRIGADIEGSIDGSLRMDFGMCFFNMVRRIRSRSSFDQSISNGPAIVSMNPLLPSNTASGPVIPCAASNAACVAAMAVFG